ncbi:MAG: alpha-glucosidase C-terminal domain-containing protein [Ignavibacteriales bacterium]|nr:alpha-glucosidase C-terminal domain-containing protein [Ignavibacteriales bacterium]
MALTVTVELVPTDFWDLARKQLDKIKPVMMLSEGTLPEQHVEAFDLTYSWNVYDVFEKIINGSTLVTVFDDVMRNESLQFPQGALRLRFNTNHDKNAWDNPAVIKFTPQGAKATAVFTFTYPGVPLMYNGEEVGNNKKLDLFEKVDIDWSKNPDFREFYEQLATLRAAHSALRRGEFVRMENSDNQKVYSFLRKLGDDQVIVVINFSMNERRVEISLPDSLKGNLKEYFSNTVKNVSQGKVVLKLAPLEYNVFLPAQ